MVLGKQFALRNFVYEVEKIAISESGLTYLLLPTDDMQPIVIDLVL